MKNTLNEKELIKRCLIDADAICSYPFKDKKYASLPVLRHKSNNKWFGLIFYISDKLYINLKCPPFDAEILRDNHPQITPAWHMNKSHWNKIDVNNISLNLLDKLIGVSFEITKK